MKLISWDTAIYIVLVYDMILWTKIHGSRESNPNIVLLSFDVNIVKIMIGRVNLICTVLYMNVILYVVPRV